MSGRVLLLKKSRRVVNHEPMVSCKASSLQRISKLTYITRKKKKN